MNRSYNEIITFCKLFAYQEGPIFRAETWIESGVTWVCKWFYSNNTELPNTIVRTNNAFLVD